MALKLTIAGDPLNPTTGKAEAVSTEEETVVEVDESFRRCLEWLAKLGRVTVSVDDVIKDHIHLEFTNGYD
jgi:hypothetical protein